MAYVVRRTLYALFVVWAAFTITWLLLYFLPGNSVDLMLRSTAEGGDASALAARAALEERYGLDKPPWEQYLTILANTVRADLGTSIELGIPVQRVLEGALPHTLRLGLLSLAISAVLGLAIALAANVVRTPWLRNALFNLPPVFSSFPAFLTGLILIQVFAFQLHLLPAVGNTGWRSLVLPAITSAIPASAAIAQVTAKTLWDYVHSSHGDYLRARGYSRPRILLGHALRNAIVPGTTLLGMSVGGILAGAVITETVFSRQGLGRVLQVAVTSQDIPVVQGVVILSAVLYAVANLVVDLIYPRIDPRITVG